MGIYFGKFDWDFRSVEKEKIAQMYALRFAIPFSAKGTPQKTNEYPFKHDAWKTTFLLKFFPVLTYATTNRLVILWRPQFMILDQVIVRSHASSPTNCCHAKGLLDVSPVPCIFGHRRVDLGHCTRRRWGLFPVARIGRINIQTNPEPTRGSLFTNQQWSLEDPLALLPFWG